MSHSPSARVRRGEADAGRALDNQWVERVARVGILSRAVNYTVLAALVSAILVRGGGSEADRRGAIEAVASAPFGRIALLLLCLGFAAYIAWQLLRAATHRSDEGTAKDTGRRLLALGTAVLYGAALVTGVRTLIGASTSSPEHEQASWTANLLGSGGGRLVVLVAGVALIVSGVAMAGYAASRKFETPLATRLMGRRVRRVATVLGVVGQAARGLVFVILGGFVVSAAVARDASRSKGLDASLKTLAGQRYGAVLLVIVALGFLAFGLYSFLDARYRADFSR